MRLLFGSFDVPTEANNAHWSIFLHSYLKAPSVVVLTILCLDCHQWWLASPANMVLNWYTMVLMDKDLKDMNPNAILSWYECHTIIWMTFTLFPCWPFLPVSGAVTFYNKIHMIFVAINQSLISDHSYKYLLIFRLMYLDIWCRLSRDWTCLLVLV